MKLMVVVDLVDSSNLPEVPGSRDAAGKGGGSMGNQSSRCRVSAKALPIKKQHRRDMRFSALSSLSNGLFNCLIVFEL